jgi:signal peptidase II
VFIPVVLFIALVAIDQLTKYITLIRLKPIGSIELINGFFSLTYVENRGAAFGMLSGARWLFIVLTLAVIAVCWYLYIKKRDKAGKVVKYALVLVSGGAVGNLIDRVFRSYVVDMLDFNLFGWDFPVFNFADICVVIGAFLLIVWVGIIGDKEE